MDPIILQQEPRPNASGQEPQQYQTPMDSANSPQVPERKHFLNKKFLVIFVVLVLLGAGSYTGIWWWENRQLCPPGSPCWVMPDDTVYNMDPIANWKTYTNAEYGFEFKYPLELVVSETTDQSKLMCGGAYAPLGCISVKLSFTSGSAFTYERFPQYDIVGTETKVSIAGSEKTMIQRGSEYYIGLDNLVGLGFINKDSDSDYQLFLQILSTFKFIGQPAVDSNLKMFVDVGGRFTIQYPSPDAGINLDFPEGAISGDYRVFGMNNVGQNSPIFYFSIYAKPLSPKDSVTLCREAGGGYIREYDTSGKIVVDGQSYTKCVFSRELQGDKVLHVSFNRNGYTWEFLATYYDRYQKIIDSTISTLEFTK